MTTPNPVLLRFANAGRFASNVSVFASNVATYSCNELAALTNSNVDLAYTIDSALILATFSSNEVTGGLSNTAHAALDLATFSCNEVTGALSNTAYFALSAATHASNAAVLKTGTNTIDGTLNSTILNGVNGVQTNGTTRIDGFGNLANVTVLSDASGVSIHASKINSGTLAVASGGTGASSLEDSKLMVGGGTSAVYTPTQLHWDNTNKRLGIGTATPSAGLEVVGQIVASDDISAFSDVRLKRDLRTIDTALQSVLQLTGYTFKKVRSSALPADPERESMGLVAQEVERVAPQLVTQHDNGYKSIAYANMAALFVESIKELSSKISSIESRLTKIDA